MLLGKDKLNTIKVLISKAFIYSYISHDEFVSVNNVSGKYSEIKKEIKNSTVDMYFFTCKKYAANKNSSARKTKQSRFMLISNCVVCGKKKSIFVKK